MTSADPALADHRYPAENCAPVATTTALFVHRRTLCSGPGSRTHFWLATTGWELGSAADLSSLLDGRGPE
ncbi:hypothetical protein [Rhodococcus sp. JVH1]|uniref:hypothetical protein n=1 Tax=Rhodococcus sp. JVH1 TaxID=745408 RepID=UPI003523DD85